MTTELDIVNGMASGELSTPQLYEGNTFFLLRLSPTGVTWSGERECMVYRDPDAWLSPYMCQRVAGLPLLLGHVEGGLVNSQSFAEQVCGIVYCAFPNADALMCVCRVVGDVRMPDNYETTPACKFGDNWPMIEVRGETLYLETPPLYISHLSITPLSDEPLGATVVEVQPQAQTKEFNHGYA